MPSLGADHMWSSLASHGACSEGQCRFSHGGARVVGHSSPSLAYAIVSKQARRHEEKLSLM